MSALPFDALLEQVREVVKATVREEVKLALREVLAEAGVLRVENKPRLLGPAEPAPPRQETPPSLNGRSNAGSAGVPPAGALEAALSVVVRRVMREEARSALADHRAEERKADGTKLMPLHEAAGRLGITTKALRSRIERGSVEGATKIGGRWHLPVGALPGAESI